MQTPNSSHHQTPCARALHAMAAAVHPFTIVAFWLPGGWLVHELLSVMSLVQTDLVSSMQSFQASLFIAR